MADRPGSSRQTTCPARNPSPTSPRQDGALCPAVPGKAKTKIRPWAKKSLGTRLSQTPSIHGLPASGEAGDSISFSGPLGPLVASGRHGHEAGGKKQQPEATDSPQLCSPACPHPHSAYPRERCIQPAPRGPLSRKHLATPTPHACPPRAGLAPPLLVFGWLLHVLAFRPRDLTAVHVRAYSPGSSHFARK